MSDLLRDAANRAMRYRAQIDARRVKPSPEAIAAVEGFREALPQAGASAEETLAMLDELGSPAAMAMTGPRFFGFVIGGSTPATLAAHWLAGGWDQNAVLHDVVPAVSTIEAVAADWMIDLLGLPSESASAFVTGATVANFTALAAARHKVLADQGWNVRANGLYGAPEITVAVSAEAHPTLLKSLSMLGLGQERVVEVPVDHQGRMLASSIPALRAPAIICAQIGNINTGAFDPIGEICEFATASDAWVHVDGAFGLWAAATPTLRSHCDGLGRADSWATDAHKWLNVPYDCGVAFVRYADALHATMSIEASYLDYSDEIRNPCDFTPELSRRARGVEVWAALRTLGREGIADLVERCCSHARRFADKLSAAGFEILNDVVLNQVLVSFGEPDVTLRVIDGIQEEGTCWCGKSQWQGKTAMRISVSNWSTTEADVDASVDAIIRVAAAQGVAAN